MFQPYSPHIPIRHAAFVTFILLCLFLCQGCSLVTGSMTENLANNLSRAIRDNNDLETVRQGSPAYLIMIDALVGSDPSNPGLLTTAALLNGTYADVFVKDKDRALLLTDKALGFALKACCAERSAFCGIDRIKETELKTVLASARKKDVPVLYALGSVWASWINVRSGQLDALSQVPRIQAIMETVVALDEMYMDGGAHLFLGTIATLLPPMLGGRPEDARTHFEKAIAISGGRNLMAKVLFARRYARMVYDRELHDRLLGEVLEAAADEPGYTLVNTLAKIQARELLDGSADYF
ncbi:MAG: TRAP transporter TatT component family protein [Pseudomonadota bacterium]